MDKLKAFIGHSFDDDDEQIVRKFLDYFDSLKDMGFAWDHVKKAKAKKLSEQVNEKMEGKDLFIGIFTLKNKIIHPSKLTKNDSTLTAQEGDFSWSTSDWVIQESGYALGKGMDLIFVVEEGLNNIGGLQGDLEYIPFSREKIESSFQEINEMISSLMKEKRDATMTKEIKEKPDIQPLQVPKGAKETKHEEEEKKQDTFIKLINAIKNKDEKKEKEFFEIYLKEAKDDKFKGIESICFYHWLRFVFGGKDELETFQKLSRENPEHPSPHIYLAKILEEYKSYDKASENFMNAAKFSKDESEKTIYLCRAAKTLQEAKKINEAKTIIFDRINEIKKDSYKDFHELFKMLGNIELDEKNVDLYFALAEKALDLNLSNNDLRFELASNYNKNGKHKMSLYHYRILCDTFPNSANWNNLGVEYAELSLEGKAVSAYGKSSEKGGTTAIGNIAHKLIGAGFLEEARTKIKEAIKKQEVDSNVPNALNTIVEINKTEEDKEKEILSSIEPEQKFRIDYAEAYSFPYEIKLPSKWKSKYGELEITINNGKFIAKGEAEVPVLGLMLGLSGRPTGKPREATKKRLIEYSGELRNKAIDYTLSVQIVPLKEYNKSYVADEVLSMISEQRRSKQVYTGQMIVEDKKTTAMEKDSKGNISFYEMVALE